MAASSETQPALIEAAMQTVPTGAADWIVIAPVLAGLLGAALALMLHGRPRLQGWLALAVALGTSGAALALLLRVLEIGPLSMTMGRWLPPFGISFTADILGAGFAFVASVVTAIVLVSMLERTPERGSIGPFPLVLLLLGGVNGAFLTGDMFNLYVWFEVMLLASFGLLVFDGRPISLDATVKYGFLNFLATAFFLVALGLLYGLTGSLNMADLILRAGEAPPGPLLAIAALLTLAFGVKAAAFPVNAWLAASYHVPPAPIAALMAGLLTKVGAYALLRTLVAVLPEARLALEPVLVTIAALTLVIGPIGAIAETNLRRALGFLLIGGIGAILAGLCLANMAGIAGAASYGVHAMLTMTALYLVAGLIERRTGASDTRQMGGLYAASSLLSVLFLVPVLAASGLPPFLGFWPKLLLFQGAVEASSSGALAMDPVSMILIGALVLNALLTLIAGTRLWSHIFWRATLESGEAGAPIQPLTGREQRLLLWPAVVLVALVAGLGLWPQPLVEAAQAAALDLLDPARYLAAVGLGGAP